MICDKKDCTGCFACYNICPKRCIEMKEDEYGCIYPETNKDNCIYCDLCRNACPVNNKVELLYPKKCYAMYSEDKYIRNTSTSGGAATIFSKNIIENGGIVYGVRFTKTDFVKHIRIDNIEDIGLLQGSKYVHSYINDTFSQVKEDLQNGKIVLFIGTPCQIAGLKSCLNKTYENLYAIDLVCHGVPPQKYLKEEIHNITKEEIDNISFRNKEGYIFELYKNGNRIYKANISDSKYYIGFLEGFFCRENCYSCIYASPNRVSDITIGDFWGLKSDSKLYDDDNNGVSVLLPVTNKGLDLIEKCKNEMRMEERDIVEAVSGNSQLREPCKKPKTYEKFRKYYIKKNYIKACNVFMRKKIIKGRLKNNKLLYKIYKAIKGGQNG